MCGSWDTYGSLYRVNIKPVVAENRIMKHERWGHQDKHHIKNLLRKELNININLDKEICEPCIYGKSHRMPFGRRHRTNAPGELLSADVCGPFDESFQRKRYLVVFKDSYIRYSVWLYHKRKIRGQRDIKACPCTCKELRALYKGIRK